ncbi:MAG: tRNA pseudouridine synthase, partial [Haloplasmataceae bacterium]|nr:tRNA pseudouridine synthase [Haloplasmataceae bacterium]
EFIFRGNGFLRYQIRIMMGTLIEIAEGKREINSILSLYEVKDRTKAGFTAEPQGLYLYRVEY